MLDKYGADPAITAMVDQFEWYIVPVANPDGYSYTWTDVGYLNSVMRFKNAASAVTPISKLLTTRFNY